LLLPLKLPLESLRISVSPLDLCELNSESSARSCSKLDLPTLSGSSWLLLFRFQQLEAPRRLCLVVGIV